MHYSIFYCMVLTLISLTSSSHFRGASIAWKPIEEFDDLYTIEINFRIAWRRSFGGLFCDQEIIDDSERLIGSGSLDCRIGCIGNVGSMQFHCIDFSQIEDWTAGGRSYRFNTSALEFEASFTGAAWISLVIGGGGWEVRVKVNLTRRMDTGEINTSPISAITPIIRLQHGCNHTIKIPVEDIDNDVVKCRWARNELGECAGVCQTFPGAILDEKKCEIYYESASYRTGWYAVALQIEDFATPADNNPLSSVPLQFLINVFVAESPCYRNPEFIGITRQDGSCVAIPSNSTFHEPIIARVEGDITGISIVEIKTVSPSGLRKSDIQQLNNKEWQINITWTPDINQFGIHLFCFQAIESTGLLTEERCLTFGVGVKAPRVIQSSPFPVGEILSNHSIWTIAFDQEFRKSTRNRFIRALLKNGTEVLKVDASESATSVINSPETKGHTLQLNRIFPFVEKESYYIILDPGVVEGFAFCGVESEAMRNPSIWTVTILDITPPVLTFVNAPTISNNNTRIVWKYNEESSSVCSLQSPVGLSKIDCNGNNITLVNMSHGLHILFIQGSDTAGNVAPSVSHSWIVDLEPPRVLFTSVPPKDSRINEWHFRYRCLNEIRCSYVCSVYTQGSEPSYVACSDNYYASNLINGLQYSISVIATDLVGNVGTPLEYDWIIDTISPSIMPLNNASIACGEDFSPNRTGIPEVVDNSDPDPLISYMDQPTHGCTLNRVWIASDKAGNTATLTQSITFFSPIPPSISAPKHISIPCGSIEDAIESASDLAKSIIVLHPCGRPTELTFMDSTDVNRCGFTFTRTWFASDDCGNQATFQQTIRVLDQQLPDSPKNGQINVPLRSSLSWPQYPGAIQYEVYIWSYKENQSSVPMAIVSNRVFYPPVNFPPGTNILWQIQYILEDGEKIPSPIWGFTTRPYLDFLVNSVSIPDFVFSGRTFELAWTVTNIGNLSTGSAVWYDAVYIGREPDFSRSRFLNFIRQNRFVDPQDGYVSTAFVQLKDEDIGFYNVFVQTDVTQRLSDIDRSNNVRVASKVLEVKLTPPPNLVVSDGSVPASTFSGERFSVRWTVTNIGFGITPTTTWYDGIYWSEDNEFDSSDTLLQVKMHKGLLPVDAEYSEAITITVPEAIFGNYTVIVVADVYNTVYEHISENDNNLELSTKVILSPPPDLLVTDLQVDSTEYCTGDTLKVNYIVTNKGGGVPFERYWIDRIKLGTTVIGQFNIYQQLQPGESYTKDHAFVIPTNFNSGPHILSLQTDYTNRVFEYTFEDNNNISRVLQIAKKLSDLTVSNSSRQVIVTTAGTFLIVNYTISNVGAGKTIDAPWIEEIYLSSSFDFEVDKAIILESMVMSQNLESGSFFEHFKVETKIPISGDVFFHILVDATNRIKENNELNNVKTFGPLHILPLYIDLTVNDIRILTNRRELISGDEITIYWEVANRGNLTLDQITWVDSILLSPSMNISNEADKLADIPISLNLEPSNGYNLTKTVKIPEGLFGMYFVHVRSDNYRVIQSERNHGNNIGSVSLTLVLPPSPDLTVIDLYAKPTFTSTKERILQVSTSIINQGNGMSVLQAWNDQIHIATRLPFNLNDAIRLGHIVNEGQLESFQIYSFTKSFLLPLSVESGNYWVVITSDASNDIIEINGENNNIGVSQEAVAVDPPFIATLKIDIDKEDLPVVITAGQVLTFKYDISNIGKVSLPLSSWIDALYLYPFVTSKESDIRQNGIFLSQVLHTMTLSADETSLVMENISFPYGINQHMYLTILPDINGDIATAIKGIIQTDRSISVEDGPLPDLKAILPAEVLSLTGGQPANLSYEVINVGEGATIGEWYETIVLSQDAILDPFDIKLKTVLRERNLGINDSYYQNIEVFMPFDLPTSNYYLFFDIDIKNHIPEIDEDNIFIQILNIRETVSTDIVLKSVTITPTDLMADQEITATWELVNNGTLTAVGYKCDTLYFSEDDLWDIMDSQVGDSLCGTITIAPENINAKSFRLDTEVPITIPSRIYRGIVRTRTNIRDTNLNNNIAIAGSILNITSIMMQLDTVIKIKLRPGQEKVFQISNVPAAKTLVARVTQLNSFSLIDLFFNFNVPPTGYRFDAFSQYPFSANQTAILPNTQGGTYYLRIVSLDFEEQQDKEFEVDVIVKIAKFEILSIQPTSASPLGNVTVHFTGSLFGYDLEAYLFEQMTPLSTKALAVFRFSSIEAYATFNITGAPLGTYSVRLTDLATNESTHLMDVFEIVTGIRGKAAVSMSAPRTIRVGGNGRISILLKNTGNTDVPIPIMSLRTSGKSVVHFDNEDFNAAPQTNFIALPSKGPGGILPPKAISSISLELQSLGNVPLTELIHLSAVPDSQEPHSYVNKKNTLKPSNIPKDIWDLIWSNFISSIGNTWSSLRYRISDISNELVHSGKIIHSLDELLDFQLKIADGFLTGEDILAINDFIPESSSSLSSFSNLERRYSSYISKRRTTGPFGKGWLIPWWEIYIELSGERLILYNKRVQEVFLTTEVMGEYLSVGGSLISLVEEGVLEYSNPADKMKYAFDPKTGLLLHMQSISDRSNITLLYSSTRKDKPSLLLHSNGKKLKVTYNLNGAISTLDILDAADNIEQTCTYSYDPSGQLLTAVTRDGESTLYEYNDMGDLVTIIYASGRMRKFVYDSQNFLTFNEFYDENHQPLATNHISFTWSGKVVSRLQTQSQTQKTEIVYDPSGNILYFRPNEGLPIRELDIGQDGHAIYLGDELISESHFDADLNTLYQIDAHGITTSINYGTNGEVLRYTDAAGHIYELLFDDMGRRVETKFPDGRNEKSSYDDKGNRIALTKRSGQKISYSYDDDNNLIEKKLENSITTRKYSANGLLTSASNDLGTTSLVYDSNGIPVQITYPNGHTVYYGYNSQLQRVYLADNKGYNITYHYNTNGNLVEIKNEATNITIARWGYESTGFPVNKTLGNGAYTLLKYQDGSNLLLEVKNYLPNGSLSSTYTYEYDRKGQIMSILEKDGRWTFEYDALGQLIHWVNPNGESVNIAYDHRGNRVSLTKDGVTKAYEHNSLNEMLSFGGDQFSYDEDGNMKRRVSSDGTESFTFNEEGKLFEYVSPSIRCTYHYEPLGNLFMKNCSDSTLHTYLVDPFGLFETDIIAEEINGESTYFVTAFGQGLVAGLKSDFVHYFEFNGDGSVVNILDPIGNVKNSYEYDPFGNVKILSEEIHNNFLYVGRFGVYKHNEMRNLYHMKARLYDPENGRFISPDPIGFSGGLNNLYVYAYNTPLAVKDPTGKFLPIIIVAARLVAPIAIRLSVQVGRAAIRKAVPLGRAALRKAANVGASALRKAVSLAKGAFRFARNFLYAPLKGAVISVGKYIYSSIRKNQDITFPGLVGNAASGFLGEVIDKILGKGKSELKRITKDVITSVTKDFIESALDKKKNFNIKETLQNIIKDEVALQYTKDLLGISKDDIDIIECIFKMQVRDQIDMIEEQLDELKNVALVIVIWVGSKDPNDIIGPSGYGSGNFISDDHVLEYKIRFENDPNATAPAQRILIRHKLDTEIDIRTFRIGSFGFGDFVHTVNGSRSFLQLTLNVTKTHGIFVYVRAGIDFVTREATWELQSLIAETGEPPIDPNIGILPPNNGTSGQGFVTFFVNLKEDVGTLDRIDAEAIIIFDQNEEIKTPPIFNTVDVSPPNVSLTVVDELLETGTLAVQLGMFDLGSGVRNVDLFIKKESMEIEPLLLDITETIVPLPLLPGSIYEIFLIATDNVGNTQQDADNIFVIDFPKIAVTCPSNCSGRGICTELGTCKCDMGYYGNDCGEENSKEPPILEITALKGREDEPILIRISARSTSGVDNLQVHITDFPKGATFNKGMLYNDIWIFMPEDFGDVILTLPKHFSGNYMLKALAIDPTNNISRSGISILSVLPAADQPYLNVLDTCYDPGDGNIFTLHIESYPLDRSEKLVVFITGLPENYFLKNSSRAHNGSIQLDQFSDVLISFNGTFNQTTFDVVATSFVTVDGMAHSASINQSITIDYCTGCPPCEHGGSCVMTNSSYACQCEPGYLGILCEDGPVVPLRFRIIARRSQGVILLWTVKQKYAVHINGFILTVTELGPDDIEMKLVSSLRLKKNVRAFYLTHLRKGKRYQLKLGIIVSTGIGPPKTLKFNF